MARYKNESISPTLERVLDEYLVALRADEEIDVQAVDRLDALLRKGKVPKFDEINESLFPSSERNDS